MDVPIDVLIDRDSKGIYGKYNRGEISQVAGMDIKFPIPKNADMIIKPKSLLDLVSHSDYIVGMPNKSVDYEYTSENRLIHPHNYMYSEFEGEDFIKKHIRNRKKIKLFSKYQSAFDVKKKDEELCKVLNNVLTEKPLSKNLDSYLKTYYRVDFKPKQVIDSSQMFISYC